MTYLWKVNVIKGGFAKMAKGMSVDIVTDQNAQPSNDKIAKALNDKYNCGAHPGTISSFINVTKA